MSKSLVIVRPRDFHAHFQGGDVLKHVVPFAAQFFARGMVMPNLPMSVQTLAQVKIYRKQIQAVLPKRNRRFCCT